MTRQEMPNRPPQLLRD